MRAVPPPGVSLYARHSVSAPHVFECIAVRATGETQRLAFVRVFVVRPLVVIMDESTSALDVAMQDALMGTCIERGITILSVGHRPSLMRFHKQVRRARDACVGVGGYEWVWVCESVRAVPPCASTQRGAVYRRHAACLCGVRQRCGGYRIRRAAAAHPLPCGATTLTQVLTLAANGGWDLCSAEEAAARVAAPALTQQHGRGDGRGGGPPASAGTGGSSD